MTFDASLLATDIAERDRFVAAIAQTGSIRAAVRATGVAATTVVSQRRRDAAFDAACIAALGAMPRAKRVAMPVAVQVAVLGAALLERAINGVEQYRFFANGSVEVRREFNDRTALDLLERLAPTKAAAAAAPPVAPMTREEFVAAVRSRRPVAAPAG